MMDMHLRDICRNYGPESLVHHHERPAARLISFFFGNAHSNKIEVCFLYVFILGDDARVCARTAIEDISQRSKTPFTVYFPNF